MSTHSRVIPPPRRSSADPGPRRPDPPVEAAERIPCFGPTGACVLELGHGGDHLRPQSLADALADIETVLLFAAGRLHDGSQFDDDMEGLLLDARLQLAQMGSPEENR